MATIITVYKQPRLIEKLLRSMQHEGFHFYLHIDQKVDIKEFESLFNIPNVFLIDSRINISWGGYSMIEALLCGIKQALDSGIRYDFINHISGQCYPIKKIGHIYRYFDQNIGKNFLQCEPAPGGWWQHAKLRYEEYHMQDSGYRGGYRIARMKTKMLPKRKLPFDYVMYGGDHGAYWTISAEAASYIVEYLDQHKKVVKFFRQSLGPDEFLFNTLIMNSPFREKVVNQNYRYIDWSEGGNHPKILTAEDFPALQASPCFFARKFDLTMDEQILAFIDDKILI